MTKIDRSKPSEVTITIDGKVYRTTVYPEKPNPPRPEQISPEVADRFRLAQIIEDTSPTVWISGKTPMEKLIKAVEERTREIVAWEQEYGDD